MKVDWNRVRVEYVSGKMTYKDLAEKYGVSKVMVGKRAKAEKWVAQREAYRRSVAEKALGKKKERDTEALARLQEATEALSESIERILQDKQQFFRGVQLGAPEKDEDGILRATALEYVTRKADMKALASAAKAMNEITKAVRNLWDLPTGEEQRARKLAERKMRLAERREGAAVEGQGGVIEIAQVMDEQPDGQEVDT
jgi:type I site-specific restriction endonuclease